MAMPAETDALARHPQPWTLDEVLALPEDNGARIELVDGSLVVSPAPTATHQRLLHRLQVALQPAVPDGYELLPGVNVVPNEQRLLIPDLVVTTVPGATGGYLDGRDIALALEILSPSTKTHDRVTKRALYAEAGVPHFLLVEPAPTPTAVCHDLSDGRYLEVTRSHAGVIRLERPFPVTLVLTGQQPAH